MRHAARDESLFVGASTVLTIHNIGYQGVFAAQVLRDAGLAELLPMTDEDDLARDEVNFLKTGVMHADALTTVSPTHANEIRTPEYGMGLEVLLSERGASPAGHPERCRLFAMESGERPADRGRVLRGCAAGEIDQQGGIAG